MAETEKKNMRVGDVWEPAATKMERLGRLGYRTPEPAKSNLPSVTYAVRQELIRIGAETDGETIARLGLTKAGS